MLDKLQEKLRYRFNDITLLERALDRRVVKAANKKKTHPFESVEFVGDRVLNLCIATLLFELHPEWIPHQLQQTYIRYTRNTNDEARNGGPLYRIAKNLELESVLVSTEGEALDKAGKRGKTGKTSVKTKEGILSDHMEALFGAIYQDTAYDLRRVMSIVKDLFRPLGLLDVDHISESNFGESQSMLSEAVFEKESEEVIALNLAFIRAVSSGNLSELSKPEYAAISGKTATDGLLIALTNRADHIVPYLTTHYKIDLQMIRDALAEPDLAISHRGFFNKFLMQQWVEKNKAQLLDEADQEDLFLRLVAQGNAQALKEANLTPSTAIVQASFSIAVREHNENMIVMLVKTYDISVDSIQDVLVNVPINLNTRSFLEKHLKLKSLRLAVPVENITVDSSVHGFLSENLEEGSEPMADQSPSIIDNSVDWKKIGLFGERLPQKFSDKKLEVFQNKNPETHSTDSLVKIKENSFCSIQ